MTRILLAFLLLPFFAAAQAPANDEPCGALPVTVGSGSGSCSNIDFLMQNATYNPAFSTICNIETAAAPDVWFKCAAPASGTLTIFTAGQTNSFDNDAVLYVYHGANCSSLTYLTCNDDGNAAPWSFMPIMRLTGLTPGDSIFVRIAQYNAATNGSYNMCITDPNPPLVLDKKVGIGVSSPDSTLDVNGNLLIRGGARVKTDLKVGGDLTISGGSPGAGKILTSDANGKASWQNTSIAAGTLNQTLRNNGSLWTGNNALLNDGTTVTVAGSLKVTSGAPAAGKVLTSDASGGATWQTPSNINTGFSCVLFSSQSVPTSTLTKLSWNENFDDGNNYNTTTNEYTAPSAGLYRFDVQVQWAGGITFTGNKSFGFDLYKNNTQVNASYDFVTVANLPYMCRTGFTVKLATGDKIDIRLWQTSGVTQTALFGFSSFTGYKIY